MSNEPLGIYEELRDRAQRYEERKLGPAYNGSYAEPVNPFIERGRGLPRRLRAGGFFRNGSRGKCRREIHPEAKLGVGISQVVRAVTIETNLSHGDLFSTWRTQRCAVPRHLCMYLIDRYCPQYSLPEIGHLFQRDHTTVMHGIEKTKQRLADKDPATCTVVANIHQRIAAIVEGTS